jgi:outer membrane protein assembly factor BamB
MLILLVVAPGVPSCSCQTEPISAQESIVTFRGGTDRTGVFNSTVPGNATYTWNFSVGENLIQGSAAYWKRLVFFGAYDGKLHAFDLAAKKEAWTFTINTTTDTKIDSTPIVSSDRLYFGAGDGYLYCLNPRNGTMDWKFYVQKNIMSSPFVADNRVFFGCNNRHFYAVNTSTHKEAWNISTAGEIWGSPAYSGGRVYIGSLDGRLYSLDAGTGKEAWNCTPGSMIPQKTRRSIYTTPAIANGTVYVGFGQEGPGGVAAVNASTGKIKWVFGPGTEYNGSVYSSVAVHDNVVFVHRNLRPPAYGGEWLYAISADDLDGNGIINGSKEIIWKFQTGENNGGSSPAVADGKVVVGTNSAPARLFVIDEKTGKQVWNITSDRSFYSSPLIAEGKIFIPDTGGTLHAVTGGLPSITITISPESNAIRANQVVSISLEATEFGTPVEGATLRIKVSAGKMSQESATTFPDGTQKVKYGAPATTENITVTITVSATAPGFLKSQAQATIKVIGTLNISGSGEGGIYINWAHYSSYIVVICVLAAMNAVILILISRLKRRKQ